MLNLAQAIFRGVQKSAQTLAVSAAALSFSTAEAATAPIVGLPQTVAKLGSGASRLADLSGASFGRAADKLLDGAVVTGSMAMDFTDTKKFVMPGGMRGGGGGMQAMHDGAANSAAINAAAASRIAALQAQNTP